MGLFTPKKKTKFTVILIIVIIVVVVAVVRMLNKPAVGVITASSTVTSSVNNAPKTINGKTVSFQYPATIQRVKTDTLAVGDVEKFSLINLQLALWDIEVQIRKLPSGSLSDDGSYNFRKLNPQRFVEQKLTINSQSVSVMSDQSGGYHKVAFITHKGLVAIIALSSSSDIYDTQLNQALNLILSSWQWL